MEVEKDKRMGHKISNPSLKSIECNLLMMMKDEQISSDIFGEGELSKPSFKCGNLRIEKVIWWKCK